MDITIELIMDESACGMYGDCCQEMAEQIDEKGNIDALFAQAVMELQFFRGCDIDWKTNNDTFALLSTDEDGDENDEFDFYAH